MAIILDMKNLVLSILSLCVLGGMTAACSASKNEKTMEQQLDSIFGAAFAADKPGAAVLVMQGDSVLFEGCYGLADMEKNVPVTPTTNFCIASVSKQFAAMCVLQLAEQGKLSLDDPLSRFFPNWHSPLLKQVTLRQLLSHTSGIPDARNRADRDFVLHSTDVASASYIDTLSRLNFEPGTQYEYINPTYQLIYQIVPAVMGQDFEAYVREHLLTPAGMKRTLYFENGRTIDEMAHGYQWNDSLQQYVEYDYDEETFFATKADGALYTSVREFALWEKALREGKIVSDSTLQLAYTPVIAIPDGANYGYQPHTGYGFGFFIQQWPSRPAVVYHTGDNGGFTIYAGKIPERDITVEIFSTRNDIDRMALANAVLDLLLGPAQGDKK